VKDWENKEPTKRRQGKTGRTKLRTAKFATSGVEKSLDNVLQGSSKKGEVSREKQTLKAGKPDADEPTPRDRTAGKKKNAGVGGTDEKAWAQTWGARGKRIDYHRARKKGGKPKQTQLGKKEVPGQRSKRRGGPASLAQDVSSGETKRADRLQVFDGRC